MGDSDARIRLRQAVRAPRLIDNRIAGAVRQTAATAVFADLREFAMRRQRGRPSVESDPFPVFLSGVRQVMRRHSIQNG